MVRFRDLRLVGRIDKKPLPGNFSWVTLNGLLINHKSHSEKAHKGAYYKLFLCLLLSIIIHSGLFFALEFDGLKSGKNDTRFMDTTDNSLLVTIKVQPRLSLHPATTTKPQSQTLTTAAPNQPHPKRSSIETNSASPIVMRYFKGNELTRQPKIKGGVALDNPEFTVTPDAGILRLRLLLNAKGGVDKIIIDTASSLPETFVESVKYSFSTAIFEPGEIDSVPVQSQFFVEIRYETDLSKQ